MCLVLKLAEFWNLLYHNGIIHAKLKAIVWCIESGSKFLLSIRHSTWTLFVVPRGNNKRWVHSEHDWQWYALFPQTIRVGRYFIQSPPHILASGISILIPQLMVMVYTAYSSSTDGYKQWSSTVWLGSPRPSDNCISAQPGYPMFQPIVAQINWVSSVGI